MKITKARAGLTVVLWALMVPGIVWLAWRVFGLERGGLVMVFALTPFVAAWAWVPFVGALLARRRVAAVVAGVTALGLAACVLPRALPDVDSGPAEGVALTVLTVNMRYGEADPAEIVQLVRDNDVAVLAVQEFTPSAAAGLERAGIAGLLAYHQISPEAEADGSGLYSRYPMSEQASRRNGGGFMQASATIHPPGAEPVQVTSVHPLAPAGPGMASQWSTDLRNQPTARDDSPLRILMGDFNATLDHRELRNLIDRGYHDAADTTGKGLIATWPSMGNFTGAATIDHVLADERIGVRDVEVHSVRDTDHRAVLASLTLPANA